MPYSKHTVHVSQKSPLLAHTFELNNWNVFVCGQGSSCWKVCAHIAGVNVYRQASVDWRKLAFTSICAQKTVEYRQTCENMWAHAHIWRCLYPSSSNVIFRLVPAPITARKESHRMTWRLEQLWATSITSDMHTLVWRAAFLYVPSIFLSLSSSVLRKRNAATCKKKIISYVRLNKLYVRLIISYVRLIISYVWDNKSYVRLKFYIYCFYNGA